jgi:hypothetical protein
VADVAEAEVKLKTSITTYKNPMEESLVEDGDDLGDTEKSSVRMMSSTPPLPLLFPAADLAAPICFNAQTPRGSHGAFDVIDAIGSTVAIVALAGILLYTLDELALVGQPCFRKNSCRARPLKRT